MANWSQLPFDLLNEIVFRFETIEDLIYFSAVCRLWNHFATMVKHKFNVKSTPWLLLAENTEDNPGCLRKVFNPFNNNYYQLKVPEISGCRCWGSAYGWLVTYNQDLELHLFNPLSKARLSLPPISSLPYRWRNHILYPENSVSMMRANFIEKVFVIKVAEDDLVVFLSYYFRWKRLAFARPGDESWTSIEQAGPTGKDDGSVDFLCNKVSEVICYGTQLLIMYEDASLGYLDISDLSDPQKLVMRDFVPKTQMMSDPQNLCLKCKEYLPSPSGILDEEIMKFSFGSYLVYSSCGLLMVLRDRGYLIPEKDDDGRGYATFGIRVYRFDFDKKEWSQVNNHLDDNVLFIGNCASMSVPGIAAGNCKPNHIYYTDDYPNAWDTIVSSWGKDMGESNLEGSDGGDICEGWETPFMQQTPLWFKPCF